MQLLFSKPNCLQITKAALSVLFQLSPPEMTPHILLTHTCTIPSPVNLIVPLVQPIYRNIYLLYQVNVPSIHIAPAI